MGNAPSVVEEYLRFLRHHRGLAAGTLGILRSHVEPFLHHLGASTDPSRLRDATPAQVRQFVAARAAPRGRSGKRAVGFAVRSFLRYASVRGYVEPDLVEAVPRTRVYAQAALPRGLPTSAVESIVAGVDRSTPIGKRDYAVLLLLVAYGLRLGEVVRLQLDDIDWRHDRLFLRDRKAGGPLVLPLTEEVGAALVTYLREARPPTARREVFAQSQPPHGPLSARSGGLRLRVKLHMARAGIRGRAAIPHALRHTLASRLLREGQPLHAIAGILGHASLQTTTIYAKVDIEHLREVALDIPEVGS